MKALLLAAGLGTRLHPLTYETPKCLVPINCKPLLGYWLDTIFTSKIDSALINLHYLPEKVARFIDESPYKGKIKTVYEKELLGTAGTLFKNREFFKDEQILLIHADNYSIFCLDEFIKAHNNRPAGCEMTMLSFKTDIPESCGILGLDENGVVQAFYEKVKNPPGNLANGAVYIIEQSIFDFLENFEKDRIDFSTEVLPYFLGKIYTFLNNEYHRDIGTMESYQKAQERL
ncbi:MAG: nucleotidyltransferase family protein [Desulfobacula sp.]|nr:nucleotidyltransferase family protein [Desulfobacula sp.]